MKKIIFLLLIAVLSILMTACDTNGADIADDNIFPQHEPYSMGIGAMPGRVVWAHDPDSVEWDGIRYWWE